MAIGNGSVAAIGINLELGRSTTSTLSIDTAENGGYGAINTCSPSYPSGSNPASYSEWRNYNHNFACCNAPSITGLSNITSSSVDVYWVGLSNCSASHIEYSTDQSNWSSNSGGCVSPRTINGLASNTTYYFRIKITCTSTGAYSGNSNVMSATTTGSCPAYGTYLSQFCSGCTLYSRYADGSCGTYDVSQGCSTACGGCCCAPAYGTFLSQSCSGCDLYNYYADGCYGSYESLVESNSTSCGCGGGGGPACYMAYCSSEGKAEGYDCFGQQYLLRCSYPGEFTGICIDFFQPFSNLDHQSESCSGSGELT